MSCALWHTMVKAKRKWLDVCHVPQPCYQKVIKLVCSLAIKAKNGKVQSYTSFNDNLQSFLASVNKDDISLNGILISNYRIYCSRVE